jgi:Ran GTPase-activating protein (RanGAP) involved in mRNA processing and transport
LKIYLLNECYTFFNIESAKKTMPDQSKLTTCIFIDILEAIPVEDWCRTWAAVRTIMLRMTSKTVKDTIDKMGPSLPAVVRLKRSFLNNRRICTTEENLKKALDQALDTARRCNIITLDVSRCNINCEIKRLLELLNHCKGLLDLNLGNNQIEDEEVVILAPALERLKLRKLGLGNSKIWKGAENLASVLTECEELDSIDLNYNHIGSKGAFFLSNALKHWPRLRKLKLNYNQIRDAGVTSLAEVLTQCRSLTHLDLGNNLIRDIEVLSSALEQLTTLAYLNLDSNTIGKNGLKSLAGVLAYPKLEKLRHLNVSCNRINEEGACSFAGVLDYAQCLSLTHLDLSKNMFGDVGASSIARMLAHPQCLALVHLNLSRNQIGDVGACSFAEVLNCAQCSALRHLNLTRNYFGSVGTERLANVLTQCTSLNCLYSSIT